MVVSNIEIHVHRTRDGFWRARVNVGAVPPRLLDRMRARVKGAWVYTAEYTSIDVPLSVIDGWVDA